MFLACSTNHQRICLAVCLCLLVVPCTGRLSAAQIHHSQMGPQQQAAAADQGRVAAVVAVVVVRVLPAAPRQSVHRHSPGLLCSARRLVLLLRPLHLISSMQMQMQVQVRPAAALQQQHQLSAGQLCQLYCLSCKASSTSSRLLLPLPLLVPPAAAVTAGCPPTCRRSRRSLGLVAAAAPAPVPASAKLQ